MRQVCYTMVCKAHVLTLEPVLVSEATTTFDLKHFDPYGETVNAFDRALHEIKHLPDTFFTTFANLQV
jgi:hypothetical protein